MNTWKWKWLAGLGVVAVIGSLLLLGFLMDNNYQQVYNDPPTSTSTSTPHQQATREESSVATPTGIPTEVPTAVHTSTPAPTSTPMKTSTPIPTSSAWTPTPVQPLYTRQPTSTPIRRSIPTPTPAQQGSQPPLKGSPYLEIPIVHLPVLKAEKDRKITIVGHNFVPGEYISLSAPWPQDNESFTVVWGNGTFQAQLYVRYFHDVHDVGTYPIIAKDREGHVRCTGQLKIVWP